MELGLRLRECPLVAILRGLKPEEADAVGAALVDAGLRVIEVPLNSPAPLRSVATLAARFGDRALIGAGTVRRAAEVDAVADAGGRLIVTPHADPAVVRAAKARGLIAMPGFFTPTEAFALLDAGADGLKLFPAEQSSPAGLRALRAVLPPGTLVAPVGGIGPANMAAWREAGAAGFGIGTAIYRPGDDAQTVAQKARALLAALREGRAGSGGETSGG